MLKFCKILVLVAVVTLVSTPDAFAANNDVFATVVSKGVELFGNIRKIVFVLGGFGLVGLSVAAIFGKAMWKWFGFLAVGLMTVSLAGSIVTYFVGEDYKTGATAQAFASANWQDTLNASASGNGVNPRPNSHVCHPAYGC